MNFLAAVRNIPFWEIYNCDDVNTAVRILTTRLNNILDLMAPIKTIQVRKKYCPWLSNETKVLQTKRNDLQKKAADTNNPNDWSEYKKVRNKVNNRLKHEKKDWQRNKLESVENDASKSWKNIKGWLNWTSGGPPKSLFSNGMMYNKPGDLTSVMNNFFVDKVRKLRNDLPPSPGDPLAYLRNITRNRTATFDINPVHPDQVDEIISKMKIAKRSELIT